MFSPSHKYNTRGKRQFIMKLGPNVDDYSQVSSHLSLTKEIESFSDTQELYPGTQQTIDDPSFQSQDACKRTVKSPNFTQDHEKKKRCHGIQPVCRNLNFDQPKVKFDDEVDIIDEPEAAPLDESDDILEQKSTNSKRILIGITILCVLLLTYFSVQYAENIPPSMPSMDSSFHNIALREKVVQPMKQVMETSIKFTERVFSYQSLASLQTEMVRIHQVLMLAGKEELRKLVKPVRALLRKVKLQLGYSDVDIAPRTNKKLKKCRLGGQDICENNPFFNSDEMEDEDWSWSMVSLITAGFKLYCIILCYLIALSSAVIALVFSWLRVLLKP